MAKFVKGDVVVIPFPFSDLSQSKRRPALVLAVLQDDYAIPVDENDFESGSLNQESNIRPNRLFTADNHIILYAIGNIKIVKLNQVIDKVIEIIKK